MQFCLTSLVCIHLSIAISKHTVSLAWTSYKNSDATALTVAKIISVVVTQINITQV